jgi:hypothetical protein
VSTTPDWKGIAARIQGLISASDKGQIEAAAARLGVSERDLRNTVERGSTTSALRVVRAVVRQYGLDPTWVLTGAYDASTHRSALRQDEEEIDRALSSLTGEYELPRENQATDNG